MMLRRILVAVLLFLPCAALLLLRESAPAQRAGGLEPTVYAITGARVVTEPGKVLDSGTIVIRDGLIESVGKDVKAPADAIAIDGKGLTVYAGFIDALSHWGYDPALRRSEMGAPAAEDLASEALAATKPDNRKGMTPEFAVNTALQADEEKADAWRKVGFTAHVVAPEGGIIVGQSALVSLSNRAPRETVLHSPTGMHAAWRGVGGNDYPRALMGIISHARQSLLDARHYQKLWTAFEKNDHAGRRPPLDPALAELALLLENKTPLVFETDSKDSVYRAISFAEEFNVRLVLNANCDIWKAADGLKGRYKSVILRLAYTEGSGPRRGRFGMMAPPAAPTTPGQPAPPGTPTPGQPQQGRRGNRPPAGAPTLPGMASDAESEAERDMPKRAKDDQDRQRKEEMACAGLLAKRQIPFALSTDLGGDRAWEKFRDHLHKAIENGLPEDAALAALTVNAAKLFDVDKQLGTIAPGKAAQLVVMDGTFHAPETQVRYVFADGVKFEYEAKKTGDERRPGGRRPDASRTDVAKGADDKKADDKKAEEKKPETKKPDDKKAEPTPKAEPTAKAEPATEIEADRKPAQRTGGNVVLRNATVLTVTNGTKPKCDLLIRDGKIAGFAPNIPIPDGFKVIDAEGLFVMPGIIDTHCHFAVSGGVNEFSLSVVPEVRVRDVIDSEDVQIYRALGGGVTTSRLLHGSANVIGGQDAVIKLKYGEPAAKLVLADAPRGVKFALGENVKRTDGRFPNSRLGVEAVLVRAFTEAQAYKQQWEDYEKQKSSSQPPPEPRRDLRLEALADILKGDLKVHCHCYRADEILMLMRVADRFGFKVKSLQHVLEGYKIAAEIADHGASCSTFSDWWAYKIEAYDAIPFNSALLNEAGAVVCLKSDSNELMRHLYQEAAKCVKYGGMSEDEALKTITINGAKQLGLEKRTGSIDLGKDADLAIFNGHPLNSYSRVEMTLVDGEIYFQRSEKLTPFTPAAAGPLALHKELKPIPRSEGGKYAVLNVTLHPVTGAPVPNAGVMIEHGKITAVLTNPDQKGLAADVAVVNGGGLHLYPGMIDAATVLGLTELGSARETQDFNEGGDFQPDLRASIAINADSELIPVTRANGVLSVVTRPTGSIIAGQSALINLAGWTPKDMVVIDPLALQVDFPVAMPTFTGDPSTPTVGRAIARKQRDEKIRRLKELFAQAVLYDDARKQAANVPANPRLEALVPYARGQKAVIIQANRKPEILEALKLADELKIKMVLSGGIDSWKVAEELKKRDIPVIVGQLMTMPQESYDRYDAPFTCAARLREAGVKFCIRSAGSTNTRNLPYEAAMAVSYGLPPDEGLKAVTLYPAQILGIADQLGSIEVGKRANLVLADGDILQASTQVKALFIDGRPLEPSNKQTRLYERYRERLKEVKEGKSPLGTK